MFNIPKIENADFYINLAFGRANKRASDLRIGLTGTRLDKSKQVELEKIKIVKVVLYSTLLRILKSFPSFDQLSDFYKELVKCSMDYKELKQSLGALNWAREKVDQFYALHCQKIKECPDLTKINKYRNEFYGRVSSLLKQINPNFKSLETSRKIIRGFPVIKEMFTVAITGFPNVGKTTLLSKLTNSKPEINDYAFTTKSINAGYITMGYTKIQLVDTPGTLNRLNKMNNIEKQAFLALRYLANAIIYVFDLTEPYPIKEQETLYNNLKKLNKPLFVYLSKTDILSKDVVEEFSKKYDVKGLAELKKLFRDLVLNHND